MSSPTFREAATRYVADGGECRFLTPLMAYFGDTPLAHIDQAAISRAAKSLHPTAAPSTRIRQVITPVLSVLHDAADQGLCSPITMKRPRLLNPQPLWLMPRLARQLAEISAPHVAPILLFILATGARPAEAMYLQWTALDINAGRARLPTSDRHVWIALPATVTLQLAQRSERTGTVFRRQDGYPYALKFNSGGQIKTALKTASRKVGVRRVTLNMLRHTWAVWWLARHGRDYEGLLEAGRWSDGRMVKRYRYLPDKQLDLVREELDTHFPEWFS